MPSIIKGPKGICEVRFFLFLIKSGKTETNAIKDEKNKIKGKDTHPTQNPMAHNNFASPKPIPSLFLTFL